MLDLYYLRTSSGALVSTMQRHGDQLLQTDHLNQGPANKLTYGEMLELLDEWTGGGGTYEAVALPPVTQNDVEMTIRGLLNEIAEWIEAADPDAEAYDDGIEAREAGNQLIERLISGARLVVLARPCGNCGHREPHAMRECPTCECPEYDYGLTGEERVDGKCRWCSKLSHTGTCRE